MKSMSCDAGFETLSDSRRASLLVLRQRVQARLYLAEELLAAVVRWVARVDAETVAVDVGGGAEDCEGGGIMSVATERIYDPTIKSDWERVAIDSWVGHTTEAMRRRYRHLFPSKELDVTQRVFG